MMKLNFADEQIDTLGPLCLAYLEFSSIGYFWIHPIGVSP